ncbi:MAG: response regulator [Verrucomicrobia bacterium]|nr:response regulator [Verrucomicrobiota bacterium]
MLHPSPGLRILVVDDDRIIRQLVERVLSQAWEGVHIVKAVDGQQGLELLRLGGFDLIVTDMRMPRLTGVEMLKAARCAQIDIPAVVLSSSEVAGEDASALGAFAHLPKHGLLRLPAVAAKLLTLRADEAHADREHRVTCAA